MELTSHFSQFLRDTVNLPEKRLDTLQDNVTAIFGSLKNVQGFGSTIIGSYKKQGSWAHQTIIKPKPNQEYDADIVLELKYVEGKEPKAYLDDLAGAFRTTRYASKVERKKRCCRVTYRNDSHVDVVPAVRHPDGNLYIVVHNTNEWERTDPMAFATWMREKDDDAGGNLRRVIRLMKYLRDHRGNFSGTKSIILTTLLGEQVDRWQALAHPEAYLSVPATLVTIVGKLDRYLQENETMPDVCDPSVPELKFNHRWSEESYAHFRKRIHFIYPEMKAALVAPNEGASERLWGEIFGDSFPTKESNVTPYVSPLLLPAATGTSSGRSGRAG